MDQSQAVMLRLLCFGSHVTAVVLRQLCYGSCVTVVVLQQLCYGSCVTAVVLRQNQFYSLGPGILSPLSLDQNEPKLN